jgi:hypothetical protein
VKIVCGGTLSANRKQSCFTTCQLGLAVIASRQIQGWSWSLNIWISLAGCFLFSVGGRYPVSLIRQGHPVFIRCVASVDVGRCEIYRDYD